MIKAGWKDQVKECCADKVGLAMQPEDEERVTRCSDPSGHRCSNTTLEHPQIVAVYLLEEVKLELEKQIGFSAQRLQLANVRLQIAETGTA